MAARADSVPEMAAALEAEYRAARAAERTAATFRVWRAGELTQAAVAWLLGAVFVRFIEDNGLIDEPLIGGPNRAIGDRALSAAGGGATGGSRACAAPSTCPRSVSSACRA